MGTVESHVAGDVRFVTFNRPGKLNALTVADLGEVARLAADPGDHVRALVFVGAGSRSFSAGMHIDTFAELEPASARRVIGQVRDCLAVVRTTPLPTVAMINGYCLGVAFELALACDLRVCADDARFGLPEVRIGIPSVADAALLQDHVGLAMAKEMILTGDLYPAAALNRWGLLNRVVPRQRLVEETLALLSRVTRHTPAVLASQKRLFEIWQNESLRDGIDASIDEFAGVFEVEETLRQVRSYRSSMSGGAGRGG